MSFCWVKTKIYQVLQGNFIIYLELDTLCNLHSKNYNMARVKLKVFMQSSLKAFIIQLC